MPMYDLLDTTTNIVYEDQMMSIATLDIFLTENPHIIQIFTRAPALVDCVRIGVKKVDNGFKDVLQKIHARTPGSTLDRDTRI